MLIPTKLPPECLALITEKAQQEPNFLVNTLGRGLFFQAVHLISLHSFVANVDRYGLAQLPQDVPDCVFSEYGRSRILGPVSIQENSREQLDRFDAIIAVIRNIVKPLLQLASALFFGFT